ncbi:MAG: hypothetical protein LC749_19970, partial [Actinobacteria bacterium]|nr:hypothetical protein [Actinomycetota bacterium]
MDIYVIQRHFYFSHDQADHPLAPHPDRFRYSLLGANETLVPPSPSTTPGAPTYSLFDLAERCLAEECGL